MSYDTQFLNFYSSFCHVIKRYLNMFTIPVRINHSQARRGNWFCVLDVVKNGNILLRCVDQHQLFNILLIVLTSSWCKHDKKLAGHAKGLTRETRSYKNGYKSEAWTIYSKVMIKDSFELVCVITKYDHPLQHQQKAGMSLLRPVNSILSRWKIKQLNPPLSHTLFICFLFFK